MTEVCFGAGLAERLFKAGQQAERRGDTMHAYLLYAQASAAEPSNPAFAARRAALKAMTQFSAEIHLDEVRLDSEAEAGGSSNAEGPTAREVLEARQALAPPALAASSEQKSFDLKGDSRTIFEQVAAAYGLQAVFDRDYQTPQPFTFRLTEVGYQDALRALESAGNSFLVALNPRVFLVARDTAQKRTELLPVMSVEIPIPESMSVQDAQELITAVQQTLDIRRISVDPRRHAVVVRDQVTKVRAAQYLFATLSRLRAQVEVEVELISVDKNSSLGIGLSLPNSSSLINLGHALHSTPGIPSGLTQFLTFGGGATFFGLGITEAMSFATLSNSTASSLLRAQIVALDGTAATLHVGDRYPIVTNSYIGDTSGGGTVYTPPPTINYQDLGLVLKVTPSVHEDEVTLDLDAEFNLLGAPSKIPGIPVVANRKFTGKVRLKFGEWAVIAGLVELTDTESRNGIAGVSNVPWLGKLLSRNQHDKDLSQVLLVLKPRLMSLPPWEYVSHPIWVGTEAHPVSIF